MFRRKKEDAEGDSRCKAYIVLTVTNHHNVGRKYFFSISFELTEDGGKYEFKLNFSKFKEKLKGKKGLWNTTRQLPDPTMAPQVVGQLFGVNLQIFISKF